jgi:hypothetical protein
MRPGSCAIRRLKGHVFARSAYRPTIRQLGTMVADLRLQEGTAGISRCLRGIGTCRHFQLFKTTEIRHSEIAFLNAVLILARTANNQRFPSEPSMARHSQSRYVIVNAAILESFLSNGELIRSKDGLDQRFP